MLPNHYGCLKINPLSKFINLFVRKVHNENLSVCSINLTINKLKNKVFLICLWGDAGAVKRARLRSSEGNLAIVLYAQQIVLARNLVG